MLTTEPEANRHSNTRFPFLDSLDIDQDVRSRLSINLASIYSGSNDIFVTPLAKDNDPYQLLTEWDSIFYEGKSKVNSVLQKIEENQRSKFGPMSISKPWSERKIGTYLYFEDSKLKYDSLNALPEASRGKGILRPLSANKAISFLKNNTNSGLPFYTRKSKVKDRLLKDFKYYLQREDPCILFTRTTEQRKTRDIWGYPIADTLNETLFYQPVLSYQRKLYWRSALKGPEAVNKRLTYIIKEARSNNLDLISVDFSSYDRSIKPGLQLKVADYYKYLFQEKYHAEIDYLTYRKSTIGLVTPDGILRGGHGIPSGSTFTNEDDSICQFIISRNSRTTIRDLIDIQGDDGVYAINGKNVVKFYDGFKRFGLDLNTSKSDKSKDYLVYLQNLFHVDYQRAGVIVGIYPTYRALSRILFQERWSDFEDYGITGKDYYSLRTITILENCKYHPLFEKLVKFVLKYDKYGLRPSQKGIRDYVKMISESSGSAGILINQHGDNLRGISDFETVKLIRSLGGA